MNALEILHAKAGAREYAFVVLQGRAEKIADPEARALCSLLLELVEELAETAGRLAVAVGEREPEPPVCGRIVAMTRVQHRNAHRGL